MNDAAIEERMARSGPAAIEGTARPNPARPPARSPAQRAHPFMPRRFHRPRVLKWLRRTHGWFGMWGAILGLLFGVSGILLNHRAVMKIPAAQTTRTEFQVPISGPLPVDARQLGTFLQKELGLSEPPSRSRVEPAELVPWGNATLTQPERWQITFADPRSSVTAGYWVGNRHVSVQRADANFFAWLNRLHKGTGAGVGWILLTDTLAGGMIVLAFTGFLLWSRLQGSRLIALGLISVSLTAAAVFALP